MEKQPPSMPADDGALNALAEIGVTAGEPFDIQQLGVLDRFLLEKSIGLTIEKLQKAMRRNDKLENGWRVHRKIIGNYGDHYDIRGAVAMFGLGALPPEEAVYPNTNMDSDGKLLNGNARYKIHFAPGQIPPAAAFWSLSMYDKRGFFIDNPIRRYVIGDRDPLEYNQDGSLDLFIQHEAPQGKESNWLPSPADGFELTMRMYSPKAVFIRGDWTLPAIERLP